MYKHGVYFDNEPNMSETRSKRCKYNWSEFWFRLQRPDDMLY